jgi:hypothetical protein
MPIRREILEPKSTQGNGIAAQRSLNLYHSYSVLENHDCRSLEISIFTVNVELLIDRFLGDFLESLKATLLGRRYLSTRPLFAFSGRHLNMLNVGLQGFGLCQVRPTNTERLHFTKQPSAPSAQ